MGCFLHEVALEKSRGDKPEQAEAKWHQNLANAGQRGHSISGDYERGHAYGGTDDPSDRERVNHAS